MLEAIFAFVEAILGFANASPDSQGIVAQIFDFILSIFGA